MNADVDWWVRELAHEHAQLGILLKRIGMFLADRLDEDSHQRLRPLLDELASVVSLHMAFEEKGGYLAPVQQRMPNLYGTIEELRGEHTSLQDGLSSIIVAVRAEPGGDEMSKSIAPDLRQWLRDIHDHERRENQLVQETLCTDLGAGD